MLMNTDTCVYSLVVYAVTPMTNVHQYTVYLYFMKMLNAFLLVQ